MSTAPVTFTRVWAWWAAIAHAIRRHDRDRTSRHPFTGSRHRGTRKHARRYAHKP